MAYPDELFLKYRSKGVLIDTNLMLLLTVGAYNQERIASFKRTMKYTHQDFELVTNLAEFFERRVTTPNILTEVDNIARQLPAREHQAISSVLSRIIFGFVELYVPSTSAVRLPNYAEVGLADSAIISSALGLLVLTDDFRLSNTLASAGHDVLNVNHIRFQGGLG